MTIQKCGACNNEIKMELDVNKTGYNYYCPYCGTPITLCNSCPDKKIMKRTGRTCGTKRCCVQPSNAERGPDYVSFIIGYSLLQEYLKNPENGLEHPDDAYRFACILRQRFSYTKYDTTQYKDGAGCPYDNMNQFIRDFILTTELVSHTGKVAILGCQVEGAPLKILDFAESMEVAETLKSYYCARWNCVVLKTDFNSDAKIGDVLY